MVASEGFEPPKSMTADLQSDPFGRLGNSPRFYNQETILADNP